MNCNPALVLRMGSGITNSGGGRRSGDIAGRTKNNKSYQVHGRGSFNIMSTLFMIARPFNNYLSVSAWFQ